MSGNGRILISFLVWILLMISRANLPAFAYDDPCAINPCPDGYECEQTGPTTRACHPPAGDPPPSEGCTGPNACGAGECCVAGECKSQSSGMCDSGGGACGAGKYLACGPAQTGQGYFCTGFRYTCGATFPANYISGNLFPSACGGGNVCMQNCSCCPSEQARSCSDTTYVYPYTMQFAAGPEGAVLYTCASPNDEWLYSSRQQYNCTEPDIDGVQTCSRDNVCRSCGCVPVNSAPPVCSLSGATSVYTGHPYSYKASGAGGGSESLTKLEIYKSVTSSQSWEIPAMATCNSSPCPGTTTFPATGSYYLTCNAADATLPNRRSY